MFEAYPSDDFDHEENFDIIPAGSESGIGNESRELADAFISLWQFRHGCYSAVDSDRQMA